MTSLEHEVHFEKGHAIGVSPEDGKNYGSAGMVIRWVVKGPAGAVQFLVMTDWIPFGNERPPKGALFEPDYGLMWAGQVSYHHLMAADLGYHSPEPRGWMLNADGSLDGAAQQYDCKFVEGGKCYYDGSGLNAQGPMLTLIYEGGEALWAELDAYYQEVFGSEGAQL